MQVSIDGLRSVPLDILKRLDIVPEAYLQELGEDHDLFAELPVAVQRQACLSVITCATSIRPSLHMVQGSMPAMRDQTFALFGPAQHDIRLKQLPVFFASVSIE